MCIRDRYICRCDTYCGACLIGLKEQNSAGKRKNDVILYKIKVTIHNSIFQIKKDNFMNTETQNYKIIVAYDGTRYKGWQVQKSTDDTIQGKLQHVLSTLAGKPVEVIGSGRTDAGVHAVGQVASFHMPKHFSKDEIFIWLNEHLPADIAVTDISNVPDRFHARYNAVSKTYVYTIHTDIVSDVFRRKYVYDYDKPLDTDRMKKAAAYLLSLIHI